MMYVRLSTKESRLGWACFALYILLPFILPKGVWFAFGFQAAFFGASALIFHRFLVESARVPLIGVRQILGMAFLALILTQLANLLMNDLLFYFFPEYYGYNETGPYFHNPQKEALAALLGESCWATVLGAVVLAPVTEELFYRGLVFGRLCGDSPTLAYLVSTVLYALLPVLPMIGRCPVSFLVISFMQYIPIGLFFGWFYRRSNTILTTILAHVVMNAVGVVTML